MVKNVSELISIQAKENPNKKSISVPVLKANDYLYKSYSFSELEERINKICNKLVRLGVKPGDKVLFFVKPYIDFCAITFALFRLGATSVFIDPGMKKSYFLRCIKELRPDVMIGIPFVHIFSRIFFPVFKSLRLRITTGKFSLFAKSLYKELNSQSAEFETYIPNESELAAILFTSGGTGKPKGVEYTHDIFINQTRMLKDEFHLTKDDVDIPGFPLFSFFTLAMGMNSVVPDMDFSNPAKCDPEKLYKNITDNQATFVAGSPAIWERLALFCYKKKLKLPSVKYLVMFGVPVRSEIHEYFKEILPNGTSYTPYGATECLPVSNISGRELLSGSTEVGRGTCIGRALSGVEVKIIEQTDEIIEDFKNAQQLEANKIGEIIVHSPNVTKGYFNMPGPTKEAKIYEGTKVWHRMGDVGYFDNENNLWFCGRKKHVVEIEGKKLYPIPTEQYFNQHPDVKRSALILHTKKKKPALIIETKENKSIDSKFISDLKKLAKENEEIDLFYQKDHFPVDVRHNIKIDRLKLSSEFSKR